MTSWIKNLFNKKNVNINEWRTEASILAFIKNNVDDEGKLKDSGIDLPDEKPVEDGGIRFAAGLFDNLTGVSDTENSKMEVKEFARMVKTIASSGNKFSEADFYQKVISLDNVISIIDDFLDSIASLPLSVEPYLFDFSKRLAFNTGQRNAVKFGLALLGVCRQKSVLNDIKLLGLHDEFTIFSVVAISNISDDVVTDLWELAKKVDGWGKIKTVERLVTMELTPEIKDWLLIEGYKNYVMYEYLALTCAVAGDLHLKLEQKTISNDLFISSAEIINAMLTEGPAEAISVYNNAAATIENFIRLATQHTDRILTFIILNHIKDYLVELQNQIPKHTDNGWTENIISNCLIDIAAIINLKHWSATAINALKSNNNVEYWKGKQAATILNIDIGGIVWQKLKNNPSEYSLWYDVVTEAKSLRVDEIIEFAIETFPLREVATGPKDSFGFGPDYVKHQALEYIITFLENYPGKGIPILLAGLDSPVTRNRNMVIKVLYKWGKDNWPKDIQIMVSRLKQIEPNQDTKTQIMQLLNGEKPSHIV